MKLYAAVSRGDYAESIHQAYASVWNEEGKEILRAGDSGYGSYLRSSAKPFQASVLFDTHTVEHFEMKPEWIALACASHNGEPLHVQHVKDLLARIGLDESALQCGTHVPLAYNYGWNGIPRQESYSAVYNNCSGKHSGMLAVCRTMGWPVENYLDYHHPIQRLIIEKIKKYGHVKEVPLARDGCSAPVFYVTLSAMARMYLELAMGSDAALEQIYGIMTGNPYLIAGHGRFDTILMTAGKGKYLTKVGAEGVQGCAVRMSDGRRYGINLKVLDGAGRASGVLLLTILEHLGLMTDEEREELTLQIRPKVKNHAGLTIGEITGHLEDE